VPGYPWQVGRGRGRPATRRHARWFFGPAAFPSPSGPGPLRRRRRTNGHTWEVFEIRAQLVFGEHSLRRERRRKIVRRVAVGAWVVSTIALTTIPEPSPRLDVMSRLQNRAERIAAGDESSLTATRSVASATRFRREVFDARPKPPRPEPEHATDVPAPSSPTTEATASSPTTEATAASYSGSVTDIVHAAAAEFGVDGAYLLSIASCESGLDPGAVNSAGYHGLFQFDQQTWSAYGYGSIYDPVAQARTAARLVAAGQASRWPNCA
jgi:hypothetical protein